MMELKKLLDNNQPIMFVQMSIFKNKFKEKKTFYFLLGLAVTILLFSVVHMVLEDKKTVNKILLARASTLNMEITKQENKKDILEAEILLLKNEVKSLSQRKDQKKLAKIAKFLADTEVSGKGIILKVSDNNSEFAAVQDSNNIVHNTDLLKIVNFLWGQGASAISINDERIVPNSHISCIGPTILVNKKRISSPFVIKAVGEKIDKSAFENATIVLSLKLRGIEMEFVQNDEVLIPAGKYTTFRE